MRATDRQCEYLNALAKRVERIMARYPGIADTPETRDWFGEREAGMTAADASERIDAYHALIYGLLLKIRLLGL